MIVLGEGRGQHFCVCLDRICDVHWGEEQRQREQRTARLKIARAILETKKPETVAAFVRDQIVEKLEPQALAEFTKAAPTGEDFRNVDALIRQAAIAMVAEAAFDLEVGPTTVLAMAKVFRD